MIPDESEHAPEPEPSKRRPGGERKRRWAASDRPERFLREIVDAIRLGGKLDSDAVLTARLQSEGLFDWVAGALEERALPYSEHFVLAMAFQQTVITAVAKGSVDSLTDLFRRSIDEAIAICAERSRFLGFDEIHTGATPTDRQRRRLVCLADLAADLPIEERRLVVPYLRQHKTPGQIAETTGLEEGRVRARLARFFREAHSRALQVEQDLAAEQRRRRGRRSRRKR